MKGRMKLGMMILLSGMLIFSPLAAFAQEEGEVRGKKMVSESPEGSADPSSEGTTAPSPEGDQMGAENLSDPTSSPLGKAYGKRCSPHKPKKHKRH